MFPSPKCDHCFFSLPPKAQIDSWLEYTFPTSVRCAAGRSILKYRGQTQVRAWEAWEPPPRLGGCRCRRGGAG